MIPAPIGRRLGALLAAALLTADAHAADLLVDPSGAGDYDDIQDAIDAARDGDRVLVEPGTYPGGINLRGKNIVLISTSGPTVTVIDSMDTPDESTILAISGEPITTTVSGFTLAGGHGTPNQWLIGNAWSGAGVYIRESALTIHDCFFRRNLARHSGQSIGGGVVVIDGEATITSTNFTGNLGYYAGGAIAALASEVLIEDSTFRENLSARGGAIYVGEGSDVIVQASVFDSNEATWGGAFYVTDGSLTVVGSRLTGSTALSDGGMAFVKDGSVTLDDVLVGPSIAGRDGGHLRLATGGSATVTASLLSEGLAVGGGAVAVRGEGASFTADGVVFSRNIAVDGGDLWLFSGVATLNNTTSIAASASGSGAAIWLGGGASAEVVNALVYKPDGPFVLFSEDGAALLWSWSLLFGEIGAQTGGALSALSGEGLLFDDPLLAAPAATPPDVALMEGSPAIGAGEPSTLDTDGTRADLGATGGMNPWSH